MSNIHTITLNSIEDKSIELSQYEGKVVFIVNVASQCGLTPQYSGLQSLYEKYSSQDLVILGVPCNQFAGQEPGTANEIKTFCEPSFNVTFSLTEKVDVNGDNRHALYSLLAGDDAAYPGDITWNFEKFLIAKDGTVIERFAPQTEPTADEVISAIEKAIAA